MGVQGGDQEAEGKGEREGKARQEGVAATGGEDGGLLGSEECMWVLWGRGACDFSELREVERESEGESTTGSQVSQRFFKPLHLLLAFCSPVERCWGSVHRDRKRDTHEWGKQ